MPSSASPPPPHPTLFPYTTLFRSPEITVPLATYAPWNLRDPLIGAPDQRVSFEASYLPFPSSAADREKTHDPRKSIAERYSSREDLDRKSTRLNSSHPSISYAVFCFPATPAPYPLSLHDALPISRNHRSTSHLCALEPSRSFDRRSRPARLVRGFLFAIPQFCCRPRKNPRPAQINR